MPMRSLRALRSQPLLFLRRRTSRWPVWFGSLLLLSAPLAAHAQATVIKDGQWRYALGAGASLTGGNTRSSSFNVTGDAVQVKEDSKWALHVQSLYSRNNGSVTADNLGGNVQHDQDFSTDWFGYGRGDYLRDRPANLTYRASASSGVGRHMLRDDFNTFDLSTGLAYTLDRYINPVNVAGGPRDTYARVEWVLTELSTHRVSPTTSLRQRLDVAKDVRGGSSRANLDSGIAVSITRSLNLTASFVLRYNGDPGEGVKKVDTLLVTGIALKID